MRVQPFSFLEQRAEGAFPDQSLTTWTTTETQQWLDYGSANLNSTTFGYATGSVRIGSGYGTGIAKWAGGSLASNGKIYAAPHLRSYWAIVDTSTDTITEASSLTVNGSSEGSVYDKITNQVISFGDSGTIIDCSTDTPSNITSGPPNRTASPIQGFDGDYIYAVGFNYTGARRYQVSTGTTTSLTSPSAGSWGNFGTLGSDGNLYYTDRANQQFLKYDVSSGTSTVSNLSGYDITSNCCVQHYDGYIYIFPQQDKRDVFRYDISTSTLSWVHQWLPFHQSSNACIGLDGRIWIVSSNSSHSRVMWYDPISNTSGEIVTENNDASWQGITIGANGDLYLIPWTAQYFHKIELVTGTGTTATDIVSQYNFGGRLCWA